MLREITSKFLGADGIGYFQTMNIQIIQFHLKIKSLASDPLTVIKYVAGMKAICNLMRLINFQGRNFREVNKAAAAE